MTYIKENYDVGFLIVEYPKRSQVSVLLAGNWVKLAA